MPLNTKIVRDGKILPMENGWSGFHVVAMTLASTWDSGEGPFIDNSAPEHQPETPTRITPADIWQMMGYHILAETPLNKGKYVLQKEWRFVDAIEGELLILLPGDELHAWRN